MGWLMNKFPWPKINQVILLIIIAEFILTTAFALLSPFFAVFVTQQIVGGSVTVMGFAITIYWITKSILQLFVARYIDKNHGEIDDFYFFLAGGFLNSIFISLYFFATAVWHIYALHFLIAVADSMLVPPFYAIFTRHVDRGKEGFEWSLFSSFSVGTATALGAAAGGILASTIGFRVVFLFTGMLTFMFVVVLSFLRPYIKPKVPEGTLPILIDRKKM